jgi:hypothetical protein
MADWMGDDPQKPQPPGWREPSSSRPFLPSTFQGPRGCANLSMSEDAQRSHARAQYMLNKTLGPDQIASRSGGGGAKLSYLEGWRAINIANDVFGYNGWYTEIKYLEADFVRPCFPVLAVDTDLFLPTSFLSFAKTGRLQSRIWTLQHWSDGDCQGEAGGWWQP